MKVKLLSSEREKEKTSKFSLRTFNKTRLRQSVTGLGGPFLTRAASF